VFQVLDEEEKQTLVFECESSKERTKWIESLIVNGCRDCSEVVYKGPVSRPRDKKPVHVVLYSDRVDVFRNSDCNKALASWQLNTDAKVICDVKSNSFIVRNQKLHKEERFKVPGDEQDLEKWMEQFYAIRSSWFYNLFSGYLLNGVKRSFYTIPRIVYECCAFIEKHALQEVGLFRVPGSNKVIQSLKQQYERDEVNIQLKVGDAHSIAGVLKLYFREIAEPLIPREHYRSLTRLNIVVKKEQAKKIKYLKATLAKLPAANRLCLSTVIRMLTIVSSHSDVNKMAAKNCAMVFAPGLFRKPAKFCSRFPDDTTDPEALADDVSSMAEGISQCEGVLQVMIEQYDELFPPLEKIMYRNQ
jgi:hypothetical protein